MHAPSAHFPTRPARLGAVVAALAGALCLAGCGGDGTPSAAPASTAAPATTAAAAAGSSGRIAGAGPIQAMARKTDPARSRQAESASALADGRYPVYLTGVDPSARTLTVDVVQYFEGQAAVDAARQDNSNADIGDDSYHIRNANPRVRTLPVARNTIVTLYLKQSGDATEVSLDELVTYRRQQPRSLFWIDVARGGITDVVGGSG